MKPLKPLPVFTSGKWVPQGRNDAIASSGIDIPALFTSQVTTQLPPQSPVDKRPLYCYSYLGQQQPWTKQGHAPFTI